jgi:hypothetical protein
VSFDLTDIEQQRLCFHFTNLQPLWKLDNLRKGTRMPEVPPRDLEEILAGEKEMQHR